MKWKDKLSVVLIILLLSSLVLLHFANDISNDQFDKPEKRITAVSQGFNIDLQVTDNRITAPNHAYVQDTITITAQVANNGTTQATEVVAIGYLEMGENRTEINRTSLFTLGANGTMDIELSWVIPIDTEPGVYNLVIDVIDQFFGIDTNPDDNEASASITIDPIVEAELSIRGTFSYPGRFLEITSTIYNNKFEKINTSLIFYYYPASGNISDSKEIGVKYLDINPRSNNSVTISWKINESLAAGSYNVWVSVSNFSTSASISFRLLENPDTSKTPVYLQLWFIVGLVALIIFFLTIILSLIGVIPQDRLPIQPALVVMALVIMIIALIGNYFDPSVHLIGPQDIAGMVIIHPITALTAGFLVAGGLEAAGAFAAAADALGRIEKLQFKGKTIFGFTGTVVILTNVPTLIAMPCGRILGAALMPAALFFGYRVAKSTGDARMVGVVVFPFIVNAAASCGPSPLGGIGTIGEGMSKMPIGSFTAAQSTGIMICTGVCAMFMRFITPMRPADLSDEDIKRENEANKLSAEEKLSQQLGKTESKKEEASSNPGGEKSEKDNRITRKEDTGKTEKKS